MPMYVDLWLFPMSEEFIRNLDMGNLPAVLNLITEINLIP